MEHRGDTLQYISMAFGCEDMNIWIYNMRNEIENTYD